METAYRKLDKLNPDFKKKVELFLSKVDKEIFIAESWRSDKRQKELIAKGLSKIARSNHQDGLAIDIAFYGKELYPNDYAKWRKVADIARDCGIEWGYDLWNWDKPHFQNSKLPIKNNLMENQIPDWAKEAVEQMKKKGIVTDPTLPVKDIPLYQLMTMILKLTK